MHTAGNAKVTSARNAYEKAVMKWKNKGFRGVLESTRRFTIKFLKENS